MSGQPPLLNPTGSLINQHLTPVLQALLRCHLQLLGSSEEVLFKILRLRSG